MKLIKHLLLLTLLFHCSSTEDKDDPLKNSKKLIKDGHKSLFYNGAFEVKGSSIKLIPAYSESEVYIYGKRLGFAEKSFSENVKKAAESVYILKEGTKISLNVAGKVSDKTDKINSIIYDKGTKGGVYIIYKSLAESYGIIGSSFSKGLSVHESIIQESKELKKGFDELADEIESKESTGLGAPTLSERGQEYKKEFSGGVDSFVIGYVNIDEYYKKAFNDAGENLSGGAFSEAIGKATKFAGEMNSGLTDSLSEVVFNYGEGTGKEFSKSSGYMSDVSDGAGLSFAVLKSFASITKGIFYDAIIKPVVQLGAITVGYVAVNAVIYPVMITTISGVSVTYVAIEVFKVGGKGIIYLVAPTAQLALAGVIGSGKFLVLESYNALDESSKVGAKTSYFASAKMIKTTGVVTEGAGTYVLAPISLVGVSSANIVAGGGVAVGGTAAGSAVAAGGGSVQVVNYSLGKSTAGSVAAVGTTGSLAVSMGHGVYRLGKAIGIPIGVGLGSGVVMSYEMTAQLSAHSILAVSDFSYLVLSLEGEKWVIYAIKDKTGKAKYLLTGAVIDLEQVKKEGNEIVKVPVSEEEMKKVLGEKEEKKKD